MKGQCRKVITIDIIGTSVEVVSARGCVGIMTPSILANAVPAGINTCSATWTMTLNFILWALITE